MRQRKRHHLKAEMNIVPYVDVMFVLLTIFMVTASVMTVGADVDPPSLEQVESMDLQDNELLVLSINAQGQLFLNVADDPNAPLTQEQVSTTVAAAFQKNPQLLTLIKGDQNATYGQITHGMGLLQKVTGKKVSLAVAPAEGS